jgi:tight adherence protein C
MNGDWLLGAGLGLLAGGGVVLAARAAPALRPIRLHDRIAPYLADASPQSRLLHGSIGRSTPLPVARRVFGPVLAEVVRLVDRVVGGSLSVRRRLNGLGARTTVEEFRIEQVVWGAVGTVAAAVLALTGGLIVHGRADPVLTTAAALGGGVLAVLGRDWWLSRELHRRERVMLAEFPVVADLLALSVVAGEGPVEALTRVCELTGGELGRDLDRALARAKAGASITTALAELAERTTLEPFSRFLQGVVVAIERGTPLADILRAQAIDAREISKRSLLEAGGRKEISMMLPVVFLILPVTVLFALFPGFVTLTSLAR